MKLDYCLHSHTYRCGHAEGDMEDYVKVAIEKGFTLYGISDHVLLPGIHHEGMRGNYSEFDNYVETYKETKKKYGDKLHLFLSFECEYQENFKNYYKDLLENKGFDYLICGQHLKYDAYGNPIFYLSKIDDTNGIINNINDQIKAIESGLFLVLAHPDNILLGATTWNKELEDAFRRLVECAEKHKMILEVNLNGACLNSVRAWKAGRLGYPYDAFWSICEEYNINVVFGGDYHNPIFVGSTEHQDYLDEFMKRHPKLNYLTPELLLSKIEKNK